MDSYVESRICLTWSESAGDTDLCVRAVFSQSTVLEVDVENNFQVEVEIFESN
jgi:hypothetical protein